MRLALPAGAAAVAVVAALAATAYHQAGGQHVAATEASGGRAKAALQRVGEAVDRETAKTAGVTSITAATGAAALSPAADPDALAVAGNTDTWGGGTISTEGDIGPRDRARFTALEAAHRGEHPEQAVVLRWYFTEVGSPVVDSSQVVDTAAAIFLDGRGWRLDGALRFVRVDNAEDADFVLMLAEATEIPSFSDECVSWQTGEPDASCTVGNLVIINDLRWRDGALGDPIPLADFRIHEINHEVGHWLGQGHFGCLGGLAAVNQQQFRSLAGCQPNAWPLPWEKAMVAARYGLWPSLGAFEPYDTIDAPTDDAPTEPANS